MKQIRELSNASPLARLLCAVVVTTAGTSKAQDAGYDSALERYRECQSRKPFRHHTEGRTKLARTRSAEALSILIKDYNKPHSYEEFARYTLGSLFGWHFRTTDALDALARLRKKNDDPEDAWMWINTLAVAVLNGKTEAVLDIALEGKDLYQRAAAIVALARAGKLDLLPYVADLCQELPKKDGQRRLWIGALSSAILANKNSRGKVHMNAALEGYIGLLHPDLKLTRSAKMVVARHLAAIFSRKTLYIAPEPWLRILAVGKKAPKAKKSSTSAQLRFFGIQAEGDRICYLIDMSDSMCKKVNPGIKKKRGATTGGDRKRKKTRVKYKKGYIPDENDIPWDKIVTRFDLAREHLKVSILRLPKTKRFCVVWFGSESGMLNATPGMVKASTRNVRRVLDELDAIVPGPPRRPKSPDGQLRGRTNLHGGLRRAFALRSKGFAKEHEYIDMKAMAQGADTIFLLSDGAPSWDDFGIKDKDYGEGKVVYDQEYGKAAPRTPILEYTGPYARQNWLLEDLRRMNVFRKVQVHCIGIGEADIRLLRRIAEASLGKVYLFGEKAKNAGGKRQ